MASVGVNDVVRFLIKYPSLLDRWYEFCESLELEAQDFKKLERGIKNGTMQYYEVFSEMLKLWVSKRDKISVNELHQILIAMELFGIAENLEQHFGTHSVFYNTESFSREQESYSGMVANGCTKTNTPYIQGPNTASAMNGLKIRHVSEVRSTYVTSGSDIKFPITHDLSLPLEKFIGRQKELKILHSYFKFKNNLILICGLGGIGKTELCKKFATDIVTINNNKLLGLIKNTNCTISRIWLHGDTLETLAASIIKLEKQLGFPNRFEENLVDYFNEMISVILKKSHRLLLVVDNVDVKYEEVTKIIKLTKTYPKMFVIVTSRNSMVLDNAGVTIKLDVLEKNEAREILQTLCESETSSTSDADKLCELVQYYPLALQQAVAYIKQKKTHFKSENYSISDYVKEFENKKSTMLSQKLNDFEHDYSMTTLVTWDITFEKLSEAAVGILKVLGYLEPDGVEITFLESICQNLNLRSDFNDEINILSIYSLIKFKVTSTLQNRIVTIHRLVQEVMRQKVKDSSYPKTLFDSVFLACMTHSRSNHRSPLQYEYSHVNIVCKFAFKCKVWSIYIFYRALEFLLLHDRIDCAVNYTKVCYKHVTFSSELKEIEKREMLEKIILWDIVNSFDFLTNDIFDSGVYTLNFSNRFYGFGPFFNSSNRVSQSLVTALNLTEKYFKSNSEMVFKIKFRLALVLWCEGDEEKVISLLGELIDSEFCKIHTDVFNEHKSSKINNNIPKTLVYLGSKVHDSIGTMEILANVLQEQCDFKKSLELYEQLYLYFKDIGDQEKICKYSTKILELICRSNLNITAEDISNKFSEVEYSKLLLDLQDFEKLFILYTNQLGQNHLLTVKVKLAIADRQGCNDKSRCISYCEDVLSTEFDSEYEKAFTVLRDVKKMKFEKQKRFLQKILENKKLALGMTHSNTIRIMEILAETVRESGDMKLALKLFETVRDLAIKCRYKESHLKNLRDKIARVKLRLPNFSNLNREDLIKEFGDFKDYDGLLLVELQKILSVYKTSLGDCDKMTLRVKTSTALKLFEERKYSEAAELLEEVISTNEESEIKLAYNLLYQIGCSLIGINNEKAKIVLKRVLLYRIQSVGGNHFETNDTKGYLAEALENLGYYHSAIELLVERANYYENEPKSTRGSLRYNNVVLMSIQNKIEKLKNKIEKLKNKMEN